MARASGRHGALPRGEPRQDAAAHISADPSSATPRTRCSLASCASTVRASVASRRPSAVPHRHGHDLAGLGTSVTGLDLSPAPSCRPPARRAHRDPVRFVEAEMYFALHHPGSKERRHPLAPGGTALLARGPPPVPRPIDCPCFERPVPPSSTARAAMSTPTRAWPTPGASSGTTPSARRSARVSPRRASPARSSRPAPSDLGAVSCRRRYRADGSRDQFGFRPRRAERRLGSFATSAAGARCAGDSARKSANSTEELKRAPKHERSRNRFVGGQRAIGEQM